MCHIVVEGDAGIATLKAHEAELRRLGVQPLFLIGSTVQGEVRSDSDADLFFDDETDKLSLLDLMKVKQQMARMLGRPADILTRDSIHKVLRARIVASALQVF